MKKIILKSVLGLALIIGMQQTSFAQSKTADELKAEREVLQSSSNQFMKTLWATL